MVAAGILLSRLAGLVRERVFAAYLGNSLEAGAFRAALRIPNFLQNLFGEGVLSASLVPVYARLRAQGEEELAGRVAGAVASVLALFVAVVVLGGVLATPWLVDLVAPGFEGEARDLTVRLVRVLFPGTGLLVLSAWCLGILNSHRKFFLSYAAPVLWNAAMILAILLWPERDRDSLSVGLAWGAVIGAGLQLGVQLPAVLSAQRKLRVSLSLALPPVREVFRNVGPVIVGRGVVQISAYVDNVIASFLGPMAVSALGYAQTIYLLPISLFGMSVAAAELPAMSSEVGSEREVHRAVRERLEAAMQQVAFFVVPSGIAFVVAGDLVVAALYQSGEFGGEDTRLVWYALAGATVGLVAATFGRLCASAFYALRDTRTPLAFAILRLALTALLGWLFAFPLRPWIEALVVLLGQPLPATEAGRAALGTVGLTASAGVAGWIELALLQRALGARIGRFSAGAVFLVKIWGAGIAAALAGVAARAISVPIEGTLGHWLRLAAVGLAMGAAYLGVAALLRVPHVRRLVRRGS